MDWPWAQKISVMQSSRSSGTRLAIVKVLEEHSNGLPEMVIYRYLKARGINVTQQAVSRNLAVLEKNGYVWKTRRLNKEVNRELWHYISTVPFFDNVAEDIRKEILAITLKAIEKNVDKAPQFENFQTLQSFIDHIILRAAELAISDEELYAQLSKIKPYAESATLIKEYTKAVSTIQEAIESNTQLRGVIERKMYLHLPDSLSLSHPYDIAKAIVDGAIKGEKRYFHSIDFLQKNTTGDLSERLAESSAWIKSRSGLPAKGDE
jgi:Fe2+ or Zn2+ uptake regulation protein